MITVAMTLGSCSVYLGLRTDLRTGLLLAMDLCIHPKQFGHEDSIDFHPLDVRVTNVDIAEANVLQSCASERYVPEDRAA